MFLLLKPQLMKAENIYKEKTCELVSCYLLSQLNEIPGVEIGLYRDDVLVVLQQTPKATERIKNYAKYLKMRPENHH